MLQQPTNTIVLSAAQIDRLFEFCRQHYVRYYDVQVELVDHLAASIEARMNADKSVSFEQALEQTFAGFGVMGFGPVVRAHEQSLRKWTARTKRQLFFSYFTWPKAGLSLLLLAVAWLMGQVLPASYLHYAIPAGLIVFAVVELLRIWRLKKAWRKPVLPLMLLPNKTFFPLMVCSMLNIYVNLLNGLHWLTSAGMHEQMAYYATASLFIFLIIGSFSVQDYTQKLYALARERYPEAFEE